MSWSEGCSVSRFGIDMRRCQRIRLDYRVRCEVAGRQAGAVQIRPAGSEDVLALAEVSVRSWQVGYAGQVAQGYLDSLSVERRADSIVRMMKDAARPDSAFLLAEAPSGQVAGFANVRPSTDDGAGDEAELQTLYVHPAYWSQGVGHVLMETSLGLLADAGHAEVILWVLDSNERARRFYERRGFDLDHAYRPINIAGDELVEVRYRRMLRPRTQ